jgi:hypothetical protein
MDPFSARRYSLCWPQSTGWPIGNQKWQRELYINYPGRSAKAVRIRKWYNFGNMVRQLVNCIDYASVNGFERVSAPFTEWFGDGQVGDVELFLEAEVGGDVAFSGTFFYPQTLGITWKPSTRANILNQLRSVFVMPEAAVTDDLVIHLRSGDVFDQIPHAGYAPPPLQFFVAAVEKSRSRSVRIVSQDRRHPYLDSLVSSLAGRGVDVSIQSSSMVDDLSVLLSAPKLCLSQGTMGLAAAWLSQRAREVFVYGGTEIAELLELGVDVHVAGRFGQDYSGTWVASGEQVRDLSRLAPDSHVVWETLTAI